VHFGLNFFPSFLPEQKSGGQYFAECLNLCELADRLGFASIRIGERQLPRPLPPLGQGDRLPAPGPAAAPAGLDRHRSHAAVVRVGRTDGLQPDDSLRDCLPTGIGQGLSEVRLLPETTRCTFRDPRILRRLGQRLAAK
jgi:hypothetical protein